MLHILKCLWLNFLLSFLFRIYLTVCGIVLGLDT